MTTLLDALGDGEPGAWVGAGLVAFSLSGACYLKLRDRAAARYGRHSLRNAGTSSVDRRSDVEAPAWPTLRDLATADKDAAAYADWPRRVRPYMADCVTTTPIEVIVPMQERRIVAEISERVVT